MLDIKSQSQLAEATADMMRACALAAARAASAPMFQGMSFWSLDAADLDRTSGAGLPGYRAERAGPAEAVRGSQRSSSYRSSSGHAVAQVIIG